jgi:hypothetical protein
MRGAEIFFTPHPVTRLLMAHPLPSGEGFLFPFDKRDGFQGNYRA